MDNIFTLTPCKDKVGDKTILPKEKVLHAFKKNSGNHSFSFN